MSEAENPKEEEGKVYKSKDSAIINILPGDPQGSPDDTLVFLDSGFLSKLSKHFGDGKHLSYDLISFAQELAQKENLACTKIFYFTAPPFRSEPPTTEENRRRKKYDKFISKIGKNSLIRVEEGRVQRLKDEKGEYVYKQKGVDALLIMRLCFILIDHPHVKKVILVTSDTDFCPVINELRNRGLEIILYSFHTRRRNVDFSRTTELIKCCSKYVKLAKEDFEAAALKKEAP